MINVTALWIWTLPRSLAQAREAVLGTGLRRYYDEGALIAWRNPDRASFRRRPESRGHAAVRAHRFNEHAPVPAEVLSRALPLQSHTERSTTPRHCWLTVFGGIVAPTPEYAGHEVLHE